MEALMEKIQASARKVVEEVCRVTAGERVLIITNRVVERSRIVWNKLEYSLEVAQTEVISQALHDACLAVGACPVVVVQPPKPPWMLLTRRCWQPWQQSRRCASPFPTTSWERMQEPSSSPTRMLRGTALTISLTICCTERR